MYNIRIKQYKNQRQKNHLIFVNCTHAQHSSAHGWFFIEVILSHRLYDTQANFNSNTHRYLITYTHTHYIKKFRILNINVTYTLT